MECSCDVPLAIAAQHAGQSSQPQRRNRDVAAAATPPRDRPSFVGLYLGLVDQRGGLGLCTTFRSTGERKMWSPQVQVTNIFAILSNSGFVETISDLVEIIGTNYKNIMQTMFLADRSPCPHCANIGRWWTNSIKASIPLIDFPDIHNLSAQSVDDQRSVWERWMDLDFRVKEKRMGRNIHEEG